jgi:hypothetical protein
MQCISRPGLDEFVSSLLRRTAAMDKFVREAAYDALDAMAMCIPPRTAVRVLTETGVIHKNVAISRLLRDIVTASGAKSVLGPRTVRSYKQQVLLATAKFLQDKDSETRHHAQDLLKLLMTECEDFESVLCKELDIDTWRRIENIIVSMRSELKRRSR